MSQITVDLASLPAPDAIEQLDFETILSGYVDAYKSIDETYVPIESDPIYKLMQVAAFRELTLRQRVNDGAKACFLGYAQRSDLDALAANFDVKRLIIDDGDPQSVPPVEPTYESDTAFRYRIQLSNRAKNTAGSEDNYEFFALSADGRVRSVKCESPIGTLDVNIYIMSYEETGEASPDLISKVQAALSAKDTRPLSDNPIVQSATIKTFDVDANLILHNGPDQADVLAAAQANLDKFLTDYQQIGLSLPIDGFYAALRVPGVYKVELIQPTAEIVNAPSEAAFANNINITTSAAL